VLFKTLQLLVVPEYNSAHSKSLVSDMRFKTEVVAAHTLSRFILLKCQTENRVPRPDHLSNCNDLWAFCCNYNKRSVFLSIYGI